MAGGIFMPGEKKVRPGMYMRFISEQQRATGLSPKGTVIMPLDLDYGISKEFIEITIDDMDGQFAKLGYHITDSKMLEIREIFKSAIKVIVYNPNSGEKATVTSEPLTVTAKYPGERGNKFKVVVKDSLVSDKTVQIFLDEEKVFEADSVINIQDLPENEWVDFTGTGALVDNAGTNLAGGTTTKAETQDIQDFLDDAEIQEFNTMYFPIEDSAQIALFDNKIKYFIEIVGKYVFGVRPKANTIADYQFITTVSNGVVLSDGTKLTATQASAWVAGKSAAAQPYEALTYANYPQAIDVNPRLKHNEIIEALKNGEFIFTFQDGKVVVEQDINSLTTITKDLDESYRKNRVMRVYAEVEKLSAKILEPNKYDNNADGIASVVKDINIQILLNLQKLNALKNVDTDTDIIVDMNKTKGDEFYADIHIQPVDSIEKFYITVKTSY